MVCSCVGKKMALLILCVLSPELAKTKCAHCGLAVCTMTQTCVYPPRSPYATHTLRKFIEKFDNFKSFSAEKAECVNFCRRVICLTEIGQAAD
jgi:hypothetical protein